jgi:predicted nucleic acid binding AN1-type Zn finger protein
MPTIVRLTLILNWLVSIKSRMSLQDRAGASDAVDHLTVAAVKCERDVDPFAIVARNGKSVGASAQIAFCHGDLCRRGGALRLR